MISKFILVFLLLTTVYCSCQAGERGNPCKDCPNARVFFQGICIEECPFAHVKTRSKGYFECQLCDISKGLLPNSKKDQCVCAKQYFVAPLSGECTSCHYSCLTCSGENQSNCLTCSNEEVRSFRVKQKNGTCPCIKGYFDDKELPSLKCTKCHLDCATCSGPEDDQCEQCKVGRVKDEFGLCVCPNNFISKDDGKCQCPDPYTLSNRRCVEANSNCGPNQIEVQSQGNKNQGNSKSNQNKNNQSSNCQCLPGFAKIKGSCQRCGLNEEFRKGKCRCVKEATKFKNRCIICPKDQVFNKRKGECDCKKKKAQKTQNEECIECSQRQVYRDGECKCVFNFFRNKDGKCQKCRKESDNPGCKQVRPGFDRIEKLQKVV